MTHVALLEPRPRGNARRVTRITTHVVVFWKTSFGAHSSQSTAQLFGGIDVILERLDLNRHKKTGSVSGTFATSEETRSQNAQTQPRPSTRFVAPHKFGQRFAVNGVQAMFMRHGARVDQHLALQAPVRAQYRDFLFQERQM